MNNREIKFRGKRIDNGEWIVGSLDNSDNRECFILYRNEKHEPYSVRVNPKTVGQFTGLTDKNGKDIYEGDICYGHSDGAGKIVWTKFDGGYDYEFNDGNIVGIFEVIKFIEVIGSIYENPELLNK